jgi:hypothetical protein
MSELRTRRLLEPLVAAGLMRQVGDGFYELTQDGAEANWAVTPFALLIEQWRALRRETAIQDGGKVAA